MTAISRCLARIDELRAKMSQADTSIEAARRETRANLEAISEVLVDLKAA